MAQWPWVGDRHSDHVVVEARDGIVTITLNNPARRNAINPNMRNAVRETLIELMRDPECRAIVLAGVGGNFCAGGDVSDFTVANLLEARARQGLAIQTIPLLMEGPKPVIAAIEGYCVGMGMGYAMACDYVIAATDAKFICGAPKLGFSAEEHGLAFTVPKRIGPGRAKRLLLLSPTVSGEEAGRIGLVDEVVEPGMALKAALEMARQFADVAPTAFALTKAAMAEGLQQALKTELDHQCAIFFTKDHEEGRRAFLEKRKPKFTGD